MSQLILNCQYLEDNVIRLYIVVGLVLFLLGPAGQTDEGLILAVGRFVEMKSDAVPVDLSKAIALLLENAREDACAA